MMAMADKHIIEAVEKIKEASKEKPKNFRQTIDMVINLKNIDLSIPKNRIDEEIVLPKGRGSEAKIGLFAGGELALNSKGVVDLIIKPEEIEEIAEDKKQVKKIADAHDFFLAEAPFLVREEKCQNQCHPVETSLIPSKTSEVP
jgi:large subunit ribosomal protein L1